MRRALQFLRSRLSGRADSEHEQALIRLAVGFVFTLYLLPDAFKSSRAQEWELFLALGVFQLLAWALVIAVILRPAMSPARRVLGAIVDSTTASYLMTLLGMSGLPLYVVYLWIIFGNGFRYGKAYLINTLALCVIGFSVVLAVNDFWREHLGAGIALLLGMIAVSLYVLSLVKRLNEALQRAEAANLAKRQFVSTVSHEMRTPLNAIIGMLELLRETPLNVEQAEMVKTVGASSRAMVGLIEDVLDFSKIEAGKVTVARESFDLYAVCNGAMQVLRPMAEGKGLTFVSTVMPDVPPVVLGDAGHLRQVLINLLANAVKFTEKGSVTLHVSTIAESEDGVRLKFSIRDTGIGIAPQDQRKIFDSFTQADQSVTRRFGGTGLGTTIAKQLVELLGGRIGLESAVGLGSTFWFELTLEGVQDQVEEATHEDFASLNVLMVGFPAPVHAQVAGQIADWGGRTVAVEGPDAAAGVVQEGAAFTCALLYADELAEADAAYARLTRGLSAHRLPMVLCAPADANVHRIPIVQGSYSAVLALPAEKRLLYRALHAFTATEQADGVVFLSDYLKRREGTRRLKVLVADDNAVNQSVLAKILERANHDVTLVANGEEALDAIDVQTFDAAILDRNMPRLGGVEVVRALRTLEFGGRRLPTIVLSADVTEEARREAADAGADIYLAKPVQASKLLESLLTLCGAVADSAAAGAKAADVARPPWPDAAVLNYETLTLLEGLGSRSDFMDKLIGIFIDDNDELVRRIDDALAAKRLGELRSLVHAMRGSAGSIGADRLAQACSQLQEASEGDLRLKGALHTGRLRTEFECARAELTSYLRKRKSSTG